jgi:hypothetical protein
MPEHQLTLAPLPGQLRLYLDVGDQSVATHVRGEITGDEVHVELSQQEALMMGMNLLLAGAGVELTRDRKAIFDALSEAINKQVARP